MEVKWNAVPNQTGQWWRSEMAYFWPALLLVYVNRLKTTPIELEH